MERIQTVREGEIQREIERDSPKGEAWEHLKGIPIPAQKRRVREDSRGKKRRWSESGRNRNGLGEDGEIGSRNRRYSRIGAHLRLDDGH